MLPGVAAAAASLLSIEGMRHENAADARTLSLKTLFLKKKIPVRGLDSWENLPDLRFKDNRMMRLRVPVSSLCRVPAAQS